MSNDAANFEIDLSTDGHVWLTAGVGEGRASVDLGPRDEVFAKLADFMGDDGIVEAEGHDEHEDPGDFGAVAPRG